MVKGRGREGAAVHVLGTSAAIHVAASNINYLRERGDEGGEVEERVTR